MASRSTTESYQIDYEINNKKVRKYTIADASTVRVAIAEHIYDFLDYHKVPSYHGYEYARWAFGIVIIAAGVFSYIYKYDEFLDNRPIYIVSAIVFGVCTAAQLYIAKFVEGSDTVYLSKPYPKGKGCKEDTLLVKAISARQPTKEEEELEFEAEEARLASEQKAKDEKKKGKISQPASPVVPPTTEEAEKEPTTKVDDKATKAKKDSSKKDDKGVPIEDYSKYAAPVVTGSVYTKPLMAVLANRHTRIRLEMCDHLPSFQLHAEELDTRKGGFWASPMVVSSVSKEYAYATFFDEEGFVYPPAIKEETLKLLQSLANKGSPSKGGQELHSPKDSKKRR